MTADALIEAVGGTSFVAEFFGIKPPSVSEWRTNGFIPEGRLVQLALLAEKKGVATRKSLFPESFHRFWPDLVSADAIAESEKHL